MGLSAVFGGLDFHLSAHHWGTGDFLCVHSEFLPNVVAKRVVALLSHSCSVFNWVNQTIVLTLKDML